MIIKEEINFPRLIPDYRYKLKETKFIIKSWIVDIQIYFIYWYVLIRYITFNKIIKKLLSSNTIVSTIKSLELKIKN